MPLKNVRLFLYSGSRGQHCLGLDITTANLSVCQILHERYNIPPCFFTILLLGHILTFNMTFALCLRSLWIMLFETITVYDVLPCGTVAFALVSCFGNHALNFVISYLFPDLSKAFRCNATS